MWYLYLAGTSEEGDHPSSISMYLAREQYCESKLASISSAWMLLNLSAVLKPTLITRTGFDNLTEVTLESHISEFVFEQQCSYTNIDTRRRSTVFHILMYERCIFPTPRWNRPERASVQLCIYYSRAWVSDPHKLRSIRPMASLHKRRRKEYRAK